MVEREIRLQEWEQQGAVPSFWSGERCLQSQILGHPRVLGEWPLQLTSSTASGLIQLQLCGAALGSICKVDTQIKVKVKQGATINEQITNVQ